MENEQLRTKCRKLQLHALESHPRVKTVVAKLMISAQDEETKDLAMTPLTERKASTSISGSKLKSTPEELRLLKAESAQDSQTLMTLKQLQTKQNQIRPKTPLNQVSGLFVPVLSKAQKKTLIKNCQTPR